MLTLSLPDLERAACNRFHMSVEDMRGRSHKRKYARPRQIVMYLARRECGISYPQIGRYLARDHSTAISAFWRITGLVQQNPKVAEHVENTLTDAREISARRIAAVTGNIERLHRGEVFWPAAQDGATP